MSRKTISISEVDTATAHKMQEFARAVERLLCIIVEEHPGDLPLDLWLGADIDAVREAAHRLQNSPLPTTAEKGLIQIIVRPNG